MPLSIDAARGPHMLSPSRGTYGIGACVFAPLAVLRPDGPQEPSLEEVLAPGTYA